MSRFEAALRHYGVPEWPEIASDLKSHIAEAESYGKPPGDVLAALGPPDTLARAYAVELLMAPPQDARAIAVMRFLKIAGVVIAGSFVSLVVTIMLGGFGLSFLLAGVILIIGGGLEAAGVHLSFVSTGGLPALAVMGLGPVALALGWAMSWLLWLYVRLAARALRRTLPGGSFK
jgi:uncharacterized membrane protein